MINPCLRNRWIWLTAAALSAAATLVSAGDKPLTFLDLMRFGQIDDAVISADGSWVGYTIEPDRGDGEAVLRSTVSETEVRIERGSAVEISRDGRWAVAAITPTLQEREKAERDKGKKTGQGEQGRRRAEEGACHRQPRRWRGDPDR